MGLALAKVSADAIGPGARCTRSRKASGTFHGAPKAAEAPTGSPRPVRSRGDSMLTERQQREIEYHRAHAQRISEKGLGFDRSILDPAKTRPWNAWWYVWERLRKLDLKGRRVLVVGCGDGGDALVFAAFGADVSAFDLSPDMLESGQEARGPCRVVDRVPRVSGRGAELRPRRVRSDLRPRHPPSRRHSESHDGTRARGRSGLHVRAERDLLASLDLCDP